MTEAKENTNPHDHDIQRTDPLLQGGGGGTFSYNLMNDVWQKSRSDDPDESHEDTQNTNHTTNESETLGTTEVIIDDTDDDTKSDDESNIYIKEYDPSMDEDDRRWFEKSCLLSFLVQLISFAIMFGIFLPVVILLTLYCIVASIPGIIPCKCLRNKRLANRIIRYGNFPSYVINKAFRTWVPFWEFWQVLPIIGDYTNLVFASLFLTFYVPMFDKYLHMNASYDYASYEVLEDCSRTTYGRHLPKASKKYIDSLPDVKDVLNLFRRDPSKEKNGFIKDDNRNASLTIAYFAQWLTHQFFNTDQNNPEKVNQPVAFNLSQLYGSLKHVTDRLRLKKDGLLKSTWIHGKEWPPLVTITNDENNTHHTNEVYQYLGLMGKKKFDIPIDLANVVPGFLAIHVVFFRHHQYIARSLLKKYPDWDDNRLFETAKMINLSCCLRVVFNDYINHGINTAPVRIKFNKYLMKHLLSSKIYRFFNPGFLPVYSMSVEFNLLYRFHQFIPESIKMLNPNTFDPNTSRFGLNHITKNKHQNCKVNIGILANSSDLLLSHKYSLESLLLSSTYTHAGKLSLFNTNKWLVDHVVSRTIAKQRYWQCQSYNNYRQHFGLSKYTTFEQISDNKDVINGLKSVYKSVDDIEYYIGLWAEEKEMKGLAGPVWTTLVASSAFLGMFSAKCILKDWDQMFTSLGCAIIEDVTNLDSLIALHSDLKVGSISFGCRSKKGENKTKHDKNSDDMDSMAHALMNENEPQIGTAPSIQIQTSVSLGMPAPMGLAQVTTDEAGTNIVIDKETRLGLIAAYLCVFFDNIGVSIILPILAYYAELFEVNTFELGILYSGYSLMVGISSIILGKLSDIFGRRPIILLSFLGTMISFIITGFANNFLTFVICRLVTGIFGGSLPVAQAYVADCIDNEDERSKYLALVSAVLAIAYIVGPVLGGFLSGYSLSLPFFVSGGLVAVGFIFCYFTLKESNPNGKGGDKNESSNDIDGSTSDDDENNSQKSNMALFLIYLINFFDSLAFMCYYSMFSYFLLDKFGLTSAENGIVLTVSATMGVVSNVALFSNLCDKFGTYITTLIGLIIFVSTYTLIPLWDNIWIMFIFLALSIGIGNAIVYPAITGVMAADFANKTNRGSILAINSACQSTSYVIGPLVFGYVYIYSKQWIFFLSGIFIFIALFLLIILMIQNPSLAKRKKN